MEGTKVDVQNPVVCLVKKEASDDKCWDEAWDEHAHPHGAFPEHRASGHQRQDDPRPRVWTHRREEVVGTENTRGDQLRCRVALRPERRYWQQLPETVRELRQAEAEAKAAATAVTEVAAAEGGDNF